MNQRESHPTPPKSSTIPSTLAELDEMEKSLIQEKEACGMRLKSIDQQLETINRGKSALASIYGPRAQGDSTVISNEPEGQAVLYGTWDEFRQAGYDIPEECLASPAELNQIIAERPITSGTKKQREWDIRKDRNLSALRLMALRAPRRRFRLLDYANLMAAVGMFEGTGQNFKTTLIRHMRLEPGEWRNLTRGFWEYLKFPDTVSAIEEHPADLPDETTEPASDVPEVQ